MANDVLIHALIVEDDAAVARVITRMLPSDFSAQRAATKCAALRALRDPSRTYRLALIDVGLGPEQTGGLEVLEAAAQYRGLVRALVTASNDRTITNRAVACGAYFVGKPFSVEQLAPLIAGARALADPLSAPVERRGKGWALTARHLQIVRLLLAGETREEILVELGMTNDTLRWHVREILARSKESKLDGVIITVLRDAIADLAGR